MGFNPLISEWYMYIRGGTTVLGLCAIQFALECSSAHKWCFDVIRVPWISQYSIATLPRICSARTLGSPEKRNTVYTMLQRCPSRY